MCLGYRLCKAKHAPNSIDNARKAGDGAARAGGRWNPPGFRAVYTSSSIALAVLEVLVHAPLELPDGIELWQVEIPTSPDRIDNLPATWSDYETSSEVQALGATHLSQASAMEVPSAVIVREVNYILNPLHPEYPADRWTLLGVFDFDHRLRPHGQAFVTHEG